MSDNAATLTAELIVDGAVPRNPVISPDGRWVAYAVTAVGATEPPLSDLWVAAADGTSPLRKVTAVAARTCVARWAPDSSSLFFESGRQLHRARLDGSAAQALTTWPGEISDQWPLAGGEVVAVAAADEPTEEDKRRQAERDDAIAWPERVRPSRLRLLDLGTGELRVIHGLGDRHVVEVAQRPDGGPLAVLTWATPQIDPGASTAELHVVDPVTGGVHDLGRAGLEPRSACWWADDCGWHLSYLAYAPPSLVALAVFDVTVPYAGAGAEPRNLTAGMPVCPTHLAEVTDGAPLALFADGLDTAIYQLDPGSQRFRQVSARDGLMDALSASRSGEMVAVLASTSCEPGDVHAGPPGGKLTRLSDTRPELRRITLGTQERLAYQASDRLNLDGILVLPVGKSREDGPFPLVTMVHGGPYDRHADQFYGGLFPAGQWLAAAGYATFLPNPRGGSGHGQQFAAAVAGRVGLEEWTDIVSGIDLLIDGGVADPDRLGIGGASHGGFMAAWAIGQTRRFRAALMAAGVSDWGMLVGTGDFGTGEAHLSGSCGWEGPGPHRHDQLSPISFASQISTPVLILHGQDDTNVPLGQSIYFHRALLRYGVDHEFVVYPREEHGIAERNHQLDLLRRTRAWFDRWLRDPAPDQGAS